MNKKLLTVRGLTKNFADKNIFMGIDLSVTKCQNLTVIGGSGQGKSVLLKCIMGLIKPDAGQIVYNGDLLTEQTANLYPSELSGGMQKRVGIARAIAGDPKILFFDEPTSGLDPIMSNTVNNLIRTIVKELGKTAITISHDLNSIRSISDTVVLLHNGKIDYSGTILDFENSENLNIRQFRQPNLN